MMGRDHKNNKSPKSIESVLSQLSDEKLCGNFDDIFHLIPVTKETSCGISFIKGPKLQKFANKKVLVLLYGLLSLVFSSAGSYFNATITTLEKQYKINSKSMGIISVGNDISSLFLSIFIAYYGGKSHRPRWIAVGLLSIAAFCLINASPHFLYGPGSESLSLTTEYGAYKDDDRTQDAQIKDNQKFLCRKDGGVACEANEGSIVPQILFFVAQLIAGVGQTICSTLGISYMDDNIKKSKTPALMSISFFMRLLGPALGYTLASACLKIYVAPHLTPVINNDDPRWIGAWFIGWLLFAVSLLFFTITVGMFPRELPRAALRKRIEEEKVKRGIKQVDPTALAVTEASLQDMIVTLKRLFKNKVFMLMNVGGVLHIFGFLPYWIYTPKMIETLYHQTASASSFYTGTLAIVFSGIGVLVGGLYISKFKPSARFLAMYHVIAGTFCLMGIISYAFIGCAESEKSISIYQQSTMPCNQDCHCDFVKYSPVCGSDSLTYISACHAGCSDISFKNSTKIFDDCSCVKNEYLTPFSRNVQPEHFTAKSGPCAVNCQKELFLFLGIMCAMKFIGASGRTSNFLVSIRSIKLEDKSVAIGLSATLIHLLALIPSPVVFGILLDKSCLVFGKNCNGTGNCWLYDSQKLRYLINFTAAFFIFLGTVVDVFVWHFVKDLKIFDNEDDEADKEKSEATTTVRL